MNMASTITIRVAEYTNAWSRLSVDASTNHSPITAGSAAKRHNLNPGRGSRRATPSGEMRSRINPVTELSPARTTRPAMAAAMAQVGSSMAAALNGVA